MKTKTTTPPVDARSEAEESTGVRLAKTYTPTWGGQIKNPRLRAEAFNAWIQQIHREVRRGK